MNKQVSELATVKINCNGLVGTGVIYFSSSSVEVAYILTAKHCLMGKDMEQSYANEDILIERIFCTQSLTFHEYQLTATDIVIVSEDAHDLALIVLPKQRIADLVGKEFHYTVIDTALGLTEYHARGFADFNDQEDDRPYKLRYIEDKKDDRGLFLLGSDQQFDTFRQAALDNLEGLSGGGAWVNAKGNTYLAGIIHDYEEGNVFIATKVLSYNYLIPNQFPPIALVYPELNDEILRSFGRMDQKREEISDRTRETVGNIHIPRDLKTVHQTLNDHGMVVIHGKPGVGKSALAKELVARLKADNVGSILTLAPEDLYTNSLNEALIRAGYTATLDQLLGSPLNSGRLVIWIESFEKVLASGQLQAFAELLRLMKNRQRLALIVTTRDYLLQKLKINFHFELPRGELFHALGPFTDTELEVVKESEPAIRPLLENSAIQEFLRTPYYLDKALRILPHLTVIDHLDEAGFKRIMWEQVVEAGDDERGNTFYELTLKRAMELSLFTTSNAPKLVLQRLVSDHIIQIERGELANRYAPTHDILEDWALIRYIKLKRQEATTAGAFLEELERSPAIRRAFRLWLEELSRQEPPAYASFIREVLDEGNIPSNWQDDVLIASLRSANAEVLINTIGSRLLDNQGLFLRKLFQLLQTSCMSPDMNKRELREFQPVGSGWDEVIRFVRANHDQVLTLNTFEIGYLTVIEDWIAQLPPFDPAGLPPAASDAAWLLEDFLFRYQDKISGYRRGRNDNSYLRKLASMFFKLTRAALPLVRTLLEAALDPDTEHERWKNKDLLENVRDYATQGLTADQLSKYFPEMVIRIAQEDWPAKPKNYRPGSLMSQIIWHPNGNDFGLDEHLKDELSSPGAYQSFVYWMLRYHPAQALDFLMAFLNTAFEYNHRQLVLLKSKDLQNINIAFGADIKTYFGSHEYWNMFRGTRVPDRMISSILMGLERSLLELAGKGKIDECKKILARIMMESNNVSLLAVIASVLQAYPDLLDETTVRLFSAPQLFVWDQSRYSADFLPIDAYQEDPVFKQERVLADRMPHRLRHGLGMIGFVAHYMFYNGEYNEQLFEILDDYWAQADPDDTWWQKFLYDMDARKYRFEPVGLPGYENYRQLVPGYNAEVQKMRELNTNDNVSTTIFWPRDAFEKKLGVEISIGLWRAAKTDCDKAGEGILNMTAPGTLASVGLRDLMHVLTPEEVKWSQQVLIHHAEKQLQKRDLFDLSMNMLDENYPMQGFAFLFRTTMPPQMAIYAKTLLFRMLTASLEERPRLYLQVGVAFHLDKIEPKLAMDCWYGLMEHLRQERAADERDAADYREDDFGVYEPEPQAGEGEDWRQEILEKVVMGTIEAPEQVDATITHSVRWLLNDILRIIPRNTANTAQHTFVQQLLDQHFTALPQLASNRSADYYENRSTMQMFYSGYLLEQPADRAITLFSELLDRSVLTNLNLDRKSVNNYIVGIMKNVLKSIDETNVENFWILWEHLMQWTITTKSPLYFDMLLLDNQWSESSEDWWVLEGKNALYKHFLTSYGFNRIDASVKFLAGIGFRKFMPEAISWVANMLREKNTVLTLDIGEKFVRKAFFDKRELIKADARLQTEYLFILEKLIGWGSTTAYILREELIMYK